MGDFVRVTTEAGIATIQLERPPVNALNGQMQNEIGAAAAQVGADPEIRAVILYGGEKTFAAGADVKEMAVASHARIMDYGAAIENAFKAVARIPKPVIAAVTGYALGGGLELALCADFRVLGEQRQGWPAGDPARHDPRRGRHPAAAAADRPVPGQGPRLQRARRRRGRGAAHRPGRPGGARRRRLRGRPAARGALHRRGARWRCAPPSRPSTRAWHGTWTRAWRSSGCTSPGCSAPRTSSRGCAVSWRTVPGKRRSLAGET